MKVWNSLKKNITHLLGHEGSGLVLDIGPGITTVSKGDHVVLHYKQSSGIESFTPKYKSVFNQIWEKV